ncbi:MAG: hypoxanthine phosphoribosyltransferase [Erysipelotrichaceae bacterium]|jgi:hypoxanthine phosphoribosyltransferase|nr:hypoxanthine phosphoribosyltransferase [Erysipelotrichaceae bacterium]
MHPDVKKILVSEEEIQKKCTQLGQEITEAYRNYPQPPLLVALLKGSVPFLACLISRIELDIEYDFMDVSSYNGTESMGDVRILKDLGQSIKGRDILLVEDIVDTGRTIVEVGKMLKNKGANEIKVVTLLDKPSRRVVDAKADFVGFEIPNEFVIGFGLDYNEKYRNLNYVGVLKEEVFQGE